MKTLSGFLLLAALLLVGCGADTNGKGPELPWLADFEKAKAEAADSDKIILANFTGSDWCRWCVKLDDEVFSKPVFQAYVHTNLVPLMIDFPQAKAQTPEQGAANEALARKYGVEGFPTILLLKPDGSVAGRTGYRRGGPEAYIEHLDSLMGK